MNVTAGPNPQDGPILDANATYAIAGFAPGKKSFVVFEAQVTGEHEVSFGGAPVHVALVGQQPTRQAKPADCMRTAATYDFVAGERYEIELGAIGSGQRVLLHVRAPEDEDHVAQRFIGPRDNVPVAEVQTPQDKADVIPHGHPWQKPRLLEDVTDGWVPLALSELDTRLSAGCRFEPAQYVQDRRLAAARRSEDADELVLFNVERDVVEHAQLLA